MFISLHTVFLPENSSLFPSPIVYGRAIFLDETLCNKTL